MLAGRDSIEDGAVPNPDAGKIVPARVAVTIGHVDDAVSFQGHVFAETSLAHRHGDVVSRAEMFVDHSLNIDVRQEIAAISNERFVAQKRLGVLDTAAAPEKYGLVHQLRGM